MMTCLLAYKYNKYNKGGKLWLILLMQANLELPQMLNSQSLQHSPNPPDVPQYRKLHAGGFTSSYT